ncbi:MIP/aquaporin family protein [Fulvivirga sedimenti]|uniref:Aquaporin family protein n=1 Tax=Fulvivirga sedimenti TaxID=2879465 RepID=A0A9X1KZF1_9BACT|nr:MIP/aquaporin family protein [Fulvivirga sedimenti]MCA6078843.1 aquaporin family protein [Fulvivirga sedimenti]
MTTFLGELIGTGVLMLFGTGVNANVSLKGTYGNNAGWLTIAFGWGLAVFVAVFVSGPISGAHINPAVTIGLATAGKFPWADVPMYLAAQMIGAFIGSGLAFILYRNHFKLTEDPGVRLGVFSTGPAIPRTFDNFLSELIGTFALIFAIFFLVEGDGLGSVSAFPVGFLVFAIGMSLGGTTGYAINPARDLSPRIFHQLFVGKNSNWQYAWIPVFGPIAGAIIAAGLYILLGSPDNSLINP